MATAKAADTGLEIKTVSSGTSRAAVLRQPDATLGTIVDNKVLTAPGAPVKRHIGMFCCVLWVISS